jgi:diadenosine tetraphosphate (Ap4A) HIT family hydrolase
MTTPIHQRVAECRSGQNPRTICRVRSGWVVLGEAQFVKGYSLLLPDPVVPDLNALRGPERTAFLEDMVLVGDALLALTDAVRVNYEILGNADPALHAHVFPRYANEPDALKTRPVWFYDWAEAPAFDPERDAPFMEAMRRRLETPLTSPSASPAASAPR